MESVRLVFYVTNCGQCFFYSNGGGYGEPICDHPSLKGKYDGKMEAIISYSKVPEDCPALENNS